MKKYVKLFALLLVFHACTPTVQVIDLKNLKEVKNSALMYSLPKTVVKIRVDVTKRTIKKGPFAAYADNLLGIKNVAFDDKSDWKIKNVQIGSYGMADSAHCFAVLAKNCLPANFLNFNEKGLLTSINASPSSEFAPKELTQINLAKDEQMDISYSDLAILSPISEKTDTLYRGKGTDTLFVKIPILEKQLLKKTTAEQAKEAADLLIQIRKRKYKNLTGRYEKLLDGQAMATMVKELDEMEAQYLSLFIGKTVEKDFTYFFEFTPSEKKEFAPKPLFYFSETDGIRNSAANRAKPVLIEFIESNNTKNFNTFTSKVADLKGKKTSFVYRIPEVSLVTLSKDNVVLASKKLAISQYGCLASLPVQIFSDKKVKIEFYPETGALKQIGEK
jgi:hypothetical protein